MKGFGYFNQFENLQELATKAADLPEVDMNPTDDDQEEEIDNVVVPTLKKDEYKPTAGKPMGSAGNVPDKQLEPDADPQLGSANCMTDSIGGMRGALRKEMDGMESAIVDESPMKDARDRTTASIQEKVGDMFAEMYGSSYEKKVTKPNYDLDTTNQSVQISNTPVKPKKLPRGW
jgi:hypothetical protein